MPLIILLLSLLMGISFLFGNFLVYKFKSKKMSYFAVGLAFMIFTAVIFVDLVPEIIDLVDSYSKIWLVIFGTLFGMSLLFLIDLFIPHHHHEHEHNDEKKVDHKKHLYHIGLLTLISVVMHNFFEGIAFYAIASSSIKSALIVCAGIAMHNIPLGIEISYLFINSKKNKLVRNILLVVSGTLGAILGLVIGELSNSLNLVILSITCGMMLYTGLLELGIETIKDIKEKGVIEGILLGAIIFALMLL